MQTKAITPISNLIGKFEKDMLFTSCNAVHTVWRLENWQRSSSLCVWSSALSARLEKKFVCGPTNKLENRPIQNQKPIHFFIHSINFLAHWIIHLDVDRFFHFSLLRSMSQCIYRGIIIVPIDLLGRLKSLRLITSRSRMAEAAEKTARRNGRKEKENNNNRKWVDVYRSH